MARPQEYDGEQRCDREGSQAGAPRRVAGFSDEGRGGGAVHRGRNNILVQVPPRLRKVYKAFGDKMVIMADCATHVHGTGTK